MDLFATPSAPVAAAVRAGANAGELPGSAPGRSEVGALPAALPSLLSARAFGWPWCIAIAAHLLLAVGLVAFGRPSPAREAPVARMVFVEPPPPPARTATPRAPDTGKKVVPETKAAKPLQKRMARPKPDRVPPPKQRIEPAATPEEVAPAIAAVPTSGPAEAVVAGISGGVVAGGVVGAAGRGPVPAGQVATPPSLVRRVEPKYPAEARRNEIAGLVVVEAILDRDGRVESGAHVLRSIPELDEEALAAVRQWRFRPARDRDGSPVRVILEVPIRFVLR